MDSIYTWLRQDRDDKKYIQCAADHAGRVHKLRADGALVSPAGHVLAAAVVKVTSQMYIVKTKTGWHVHRLDNGCHVYTVNPQAVFVDASEDASVVVFGTDDNAHVYISGTLVSKITSNTWFSVSRCGAILYTFNETAFFGVKSAACATDMPVAPLFSMPTAGSALNHTTATSEWAAIYTRENHTLHVTRYTWCDQSPLTRNLQHADVCDIAPSHDGRCLVVVCRTFIMLIHINSCSVTKTMLTVAHDMAPLVCTSPGLVHLVARSGLSHAYETDTIEDRILVFTMGMSRVNMPYPPELMLYMADELDLFSDIVTH